MKSRPSFLPEFAGIALADILANSVAMIIILIVITISIKHQQEQEQLEDYQEVSVLLSRDIATSVVMNGLPTSALARLHDYENSPMDRNPQPHIMPIIELHKGFVRDYYTGQRFPREMLLLQDNPFDRFIQSLSPSQHRRIRVDVYDIQLFYIAMSIIRKYGRLPSHWHFLDAWEDDGGGAEQLARSNQDAKKDKDDTEQPQPGESQSDGDSENSTDRIWESFPSEVELDMPSSDEQYPFDDLAYDTEMSQLQAQNEYGESMQGERDKDRQNRESQLSDRMFETLSKIMAGTLNQKATRSGLPSVVQFRTATPSSRKSFEEKMQQLLDMQGRPGNKPSASYLSLMLSLFNFMQKADTAAQAGDYSILERFDFQRDIVTPALTIQAPTDPATLNFFGNLVQNLMKMGEESKALRVTQDTSSEFAYNALKLAPNKPLKTASFLSTPDQPALNFLPGEAEIQMRFGLFPAIYKGLSTLLDQSHILLIPTDTVAPDINRWRVASLSNPKRGDYLLAFIYGHFTDDGEFIITSDENGAQINHLYTYTSYPPVPFRKEKESFLIVGIVALILLFGVMRRFKQVA